MNLEKIWKNRRQILEGIKNSVFQREAVEAIAKEREKVCKACQYYDPEGTKCEVPGTQPCCGDCGCSLHLKTRCLSCGCSKGFWEPVLTEAEEDNHDILNDESSN